MSSVSTSNIAEPKVLANAQDRYVVSRADLPLSCPMPSMTLWNSHPRVYLAIEDEGGESACPYCGAHFVLQSDSGQAG